MARGDRIKALREQKGITQTELAKIIGTTKQNIYKYENNIITNVPSDKIELLASYFNVEPSYFMGWDVASNRAFIDEAVLRNNLSKNGEQLLQTYLNMDKGLRESIELYMLSMLETAKKNYIEVEPSSDLAHITKEDLDNIRIAPKGLKTSETNSETANEFDFEIKDVNKRYSESSNKNKRKP